MKEFLLNMLNYNKWANELAIQSIRDMKEEKAYKIMSHILDAQIIWLVRIKDAENASRNFWHLYNIDELNYLSEKSNKDWKEFIDSLNEEDLNKKVSYTNSKGEKYSNKIGIILTHVINHSSYHRGQVASVVRSERAEPALTDFIVFSR